MESIYILFIFIGTVFNTDIPDEEGVLVLNNANFDEVIVKNENVLVEFYAPWCGHCKALAPEYADAAEKLSKQNSQIKLAKVDATIETELVSKYKIKGYPTLKFFRKGKMSDYKGGKTADTIIEWLKKKSGAPAVVITTVDQAKAFINSKDVIVVGFFSNLSSLAYQVFESVAADIDNILFGVTTENDVFNQYRVAAAVDTIVLFKKFDEGRNDYVGAIVAEEIRSFIEKYQMPIVVELKKETSEIIFNGPIKKHCLGFFGNAPELRQAFESVGKNFFGKVLFVHVNTDEGETADVLEFFHITKADIPTFRVIEMGTNIIKYKPDNGSFNVSNIESFVQSVLDGTVAPHFMSQEVPDYWDSSPVKVLVGKNFDSVARDRSKTVFVEFYAPWCGHCKELAPIWDELGELYKDREDLVIAKIDSTMNELAGLFIQGFPTLKYFPKDSDEIIEYKGERTLDGFRIFLDSNGTEGNKAKNEEGDDEEEEQEEEHGEHEKKEDEVKTKEEL